MKLILKVFVFILLHTHEANFLFVQLDRHDLYYIAYGVLQQIFLNASTWCVFDCPFAILPELKRKVGAFQ